MKTIKTKLYSYNELTPEAQETAFENWQRQQEECSYILEHVYSDISESLKGLCDCLDVKLMDYSYGPYDRNYRIKTSYPSIDAEGNKLSAYVMRRLIDAGYERQKTFKDFANLSFPGLCKFTGVCYDEDLAQNLCKEIMIEGNTWKDAWNNVAYEICKSCESELEYLTSKEWFIQSMDNDEIYTEDGYIF